MRGRVRARRRHVRRAAAACLAAALHVPGTAPGIAAQEEHDGDAGKAGPAVLAFSPGVRAMALGGAFPAGDGSDAALLRHPALLEGSGFGVAYHSLGAGGGFVAATAGGPWLGGVAGIGMAFTDRAEALHGHSERRGREARGHGEFGGGSSFAVSAGFAGEALGIRIGGAAKVVGQDDGLSRSRTLALDVGAGMDAGPVVIALTAQNLGPGLSRNGETTPLATRVAVGAGMERTAMGPLDVGGAVQLARDGDGEIVPGGGVEIAWWPVVGRVFVARFGAVRVLREHASPFTFGGGFAGDRIRLDYAYQGNGHDGGTHAAGLAFR